MGNKLSGAGKGSRLKDQHELEPSRTSPPPGMEGASSGSWALNTTQAKGPGVGKLTTTKCKQLTVAERLQALQAPLPAPASCIGVLVHSKECGCRLCALGGLGS